GLSCDLHTALRQPVFGVQAHALGVENSQEVVGAELESLASELRRRTRGSRGQLEMDEALPLLQITRDRALGFLERKERRSLIVCERDFGCGVGGQDSLTNAVP